jgi:hypothetical protein
VPCAFEQESPQVRQFSSVPSGVSQPGALVQSPKPALQVVTAQVPVLQVSPAFGRLHATPQSLQLVFVRMSVSQPLSRSPSQLFQPVLQVGEQPPAVQLVAPWRFEQVSPQPRQFETVPS